MTLKQFHFSWNCCPLGIRECVRLRFSDWGRADPVLFRSFLHLQLLFMTKITRSDMRLLMLYMKSIAAQLTKRACGWSFLGYFAFHLTKMNRQEKIPRVEWHLHPKSHVAKY